MSNYNTTNTFSIISKVWAFCNNSGDGAGRYFFNKRGILILLMLLTTIKVFPQDQMKAPGQLLSEAGGFMENKGQLYDQFHKENTEVKYLLKTKGMNVQLRKNSFSYDTYEILAAPAVSSRHGFSGGIIKKPGPVTYRFHRIDIQFPGANPSPQIIAEEGSANYAVYYTSPGHNEGIKADYFGRVRYKKIYPGIDVVFDTRNIRGERGFEYYFIVKPGANANRIKLKYNGASTSLSNNRITMNVAGGKLEENIPASFVTGEPTPNLRHLTGKATVNVVYKEYGKGIYKFSVPVYDKSKTLIIDPTPDLVWGTYYGGGDIDVALSIASNADGTIVIGGGSGSNGLATTGAYQTTLIGGSDAVIGKFHHDGSLIWVTYFGGEYDEQALGICTDNNGNIFIAGITDSKTGIATPGCHQPVHGDTVYGRDGFLAKFNAAGNKIWATYYGGTDQEYLHAVKADANGNIFIAGWTYSLNGISTAGAYQPAYAGGSGPMDMGDGFLARFNNNGNRIWATYYGGASSDNFYGLELDKNNNIYASGGTNSNGIASPGAFQTTRGGGVSDALMVKFDNNGNRIWASYYGGNDEDYSKAITCDNGGNVILSGITMSQSGISTAGTHQPASGGGIDKRDGFIVKFNPAGNRLWGTYYGSSADEFIHGLNSDINNNIIFCGTTSSDNNIATNNAYQIIGPTALGFWTPFVVKLDNNGNRIWGTYYGYGGFGNGDAFGVVTDNAGSVFVCGTTVSPNGIATCNAVQQTLGGNADMFVAMFSETITPLIVSAFINSDQNGSACADTPVNFTAVALNGGTNPVYQWKVNGINSGTNNAVFAANNLNNGDKISCTVTSNVPCITDPVGNSNIIAVSFIPSVIPAISISSSFAGSICQGSTVVFKAVPLNGGTSPVYQWEINGIKTGTNDSAFTTANLVNGDVVICELINLNSCNTITSAVSNSIAVTVQSAITPAITITSSIAKVCQGKPVTFTALAVNAGNNPVYQWKVNGNITGSNSIYITSNLLDKDIVQCILTADNTVCVSSQNTVSNKIGIDIYPFPAFTFQPSHPFISKGDTVQLSVVGTNISQYKWTPAQYISNDVVYNPLVWPESTQTYSLEANSVNGCITSKKIIVTVISKIFIPSAFTPNNDGLNDYWGIKGLELHPNCTISIFNRYGEGIYQSAGYNTQWRGTDRKGKLLNGTFVYSIDLKNGSKILMGNVSIIR